MVYIVFILAITFFIQVISYLSSFQEKASLLIFYVDLLISVTICLLISKKFARFIDIAPCFVILFREMAIVFFHACYHYDLGINLDDIERSQYNGTMFFLFVTVGIVGVSNFKLFLMLTTPISMLSMCGNIYLMAEWPTVGCECANQFKWKNEIAGFTRIILPILMGIYF